VRFRNVYRVRRARARGPSRTRPVGETTVNNRARVISSCCRHCEEKNFAGKIEKRTAFTPRPKSRDSRKTVSGDSALQGETIKWRIRRRLQVRRENPLGRFYENVFERLSGTDLGRRTSRVVSHGRPVRTRPRRNKAVRRRRAPTTDDGNKYAAVCRTSSKRIYERDKDAVIIIIIIVVVIVFSYEKGEILDRIHASFFCSKPFTLFNKRRRCSRVRTTEINQNIWIENRV